jgi:parvulin-like peptidyl-prolyl isomerase
MRRTSILLLTVTLAALSVVLCGCGGDKHDAGDEVVARVDGQAITQSQVDQVVKAADLSGGSIDDQAARQALVNEVLVRREAERFNVTVGEGEVERRITAVQESLGGREGLDAELQKVGLTLAEYEERVRFSLLAEELARTKFADVRAGDDRARRFYRRNRGRFVDPATVDLGDIVMKTEMGAKEVIRRLRGGQGFEHAAHQFSIDPEARAKGGRLGWVTVASLPPRVHAAVAGLRRGEVSAPVRALNGWHVLKVYGRRAERRYSFAQVRDEILVELTQRRRSAALRDWLDQARAAADVTSGP